MKNILKCVAVAAVSAGALLATASAGNAYNGDFNRFSSDQRYNAYDSYAYAPGPDDGFSGYGYAYAPRNYEGGYAYNPWSRSRSLNHGQGPGCIQSPASYEYTSCD